ncbi:Uncharacterised protein [Klebsiella pneumoniae]|nr:Uncharacterised protein [Klebsiella pneumoniae]
MRERIDHPGQGLHCGPENQPGAQHNPWPQAIQQNTGGQLREAVGERKGGEQHPELGGAKAQVGAYRLPGDAQRRAVKKVDDTGDKQQRQGDLLHPTDA